MALRLPARPAPVTLSHVEDELRRCVLADPSAPPPNAWTVEVPARDLRGRDQELQDWSGPLREAAMAATQERGSFVHGVVTVDVRTAADLRRGRVRVSGLPMSGAPPPPETGPDVPGRPRLVLPTGGTALWGSHASGGVQDEVLLRPGSMVVGSGAGADVRLTAAGLAERHLVLDVRADGTGVALRDLGSAAGTVVNGMRRPTMALHDGARLQLGDATLVLRIDPLAAAGRQGGGPRDEEVSGDEDQGASSGTPVGPAQAAAGVRRTPNALWLAVALMVVGAVLVGLAVGTLSTSNALAGGLAAVGVALGLTGVTMAWRRRIFEDVT